MMDPQPNRTDWNKLLKKKFTANDALVVAVNLVPLIGVWVWGWNAKEMFLVYCLESVIVGLYTVIQMFFTALVKKSDVWNDETGTRMPGFFFIFFFIMHYGFFIFIQVGMFLNVMDFPGINDFSSVFTFVFHFPRYLSNDAILVLIIFVFSYGVMVTRKYLWSGTYKTASMGITMFTPYPRIFVQQFVVILGSFILVFGPGATRMFMLIFVIVKIFFELILDYDRMMEEVRKQSANVVKKDN